MRGSKEGVAAALREMREVIERDGMLLANTRFLETLPGEEARTELVRFRTVGR